MAYHRSLTSQNMARSGLLSRNLSVLGPLWPPWVLISSRIPLQYEKASRVLSQRQGGKFHAPDDSSLKLCSSPLMVDVV
jgi:hypothetical protein